MPDLTLPLHFCRVHNTAIFEAWMRIEQDTFVRVIPFEILGPVGDPVPEVVEPITLRCWNAGGVMQYEAASERDLQLAEEWARRYRDVPVEDFFRPLPWLAG